MGFKHNIISILYYIIIPILFVFAVIYAILGLLLGLSNHKTWIDRAIDSALGGLNNEKRNIR